MANFYSPSSSDASDALAGQSAGSASTLFITWVGLLSTAVFMAVVVLGGSSYLKLGIERQVTVAALRCFIQLSLLGYILVPIFSRNAWWLTCMWLTLMVTASGMEAAGRPAYTYPGMSRHVLAAMSGGALTASLYGLTATLHAGLSAQYAIPITGMLLGNATSGVAVALSTVLAALKDSRDGVEARLAMGATRWEATRPLLVTSLTTGLTPVLNQMSIIGLVSIPGMMTGQILAGSDPSLAARYQAVIMFLVMAGTSAGATGACVLALLALTDRDHRLHSERLTKRAKGKGDPVAALLDAAQRAVPTVQALAAAGWQRAGVAVARLRGGSAEAGLEYAAVGGGAEEEGALLRTQA